MFEGEGLVIFSCFGGIEYKSYDCRSAVKLMICCLIGKMIKKQGLWRQGLYSYLIA